MNIFLKAKKKRKILNNNSRYKEKISSSKNYKETHQKPEVQNF